MRVLGMDQGGAIPRNKTYWWIRAVRFLCHADLRRVKAFAVLCIVAGSIVLLGFKLIGFLVSYCVGLFTGVVVSGLCAALKNGKQ